MNLIISRYIFFCFNLLWSLFVYLIPNVFTAHFWLAPKYKLWLLCWLKIRPIKTQCNIKICVPLNRTRFMVGFENIARGADWNLIDVWAPFSISMGYLWWQYGRRHGWSLIILKITMSFVFLHCLNTKMALSWCYYPNKRLFCPDDPFFEVFDWFFAEQKPMSKYDMQHSVNRKVTFSAISNESKSTAVKLKTLMNGNVFLALV